MDLLELINRYQDAMNTIDRNVNLILKEKIHTEITTDQFPTLQYIQKHQQCTSSEIAAFLGVGKSAITAQINRLDEKGLIIRRRDKQDRRIVYLQLTEKGNELVDYTRNNLTKEIGTYLGNFNEEEIHTFIHALEKLAHVMATDKKGDQ
ncbi:MarR family winged helix-turn-helix transcriptional regulator [Virgibacillus halodenitrificans]|uniref:MarR family transcriptional regulator n=2 Tax=Virgibacillus halodenitrificans TaxID=1482 RepID=A0AAC9NMA9_VIRHA|nr:MarR family transcriptional regulator [Virgibacillus halodenitrificans]APC49509.1 MarR family transcriptional regulator [Virgibacillus halodenitrificans]MBD1221190.1 MarR family transcriptional regulator [Virgibacillus halodenitrificans]MCJ0929836.1 MarR family transcriptional regulator [Virgibacillus halodenitrificans]MYL45195.1 MarR family transcriptional regulator [Virgibacillus halodenitrificans]WHX26329.1 MarR family transcriptional regulator [Virgibacillus halodenitrificans]